MNSVKLTGNCCDETIAASNLRNGQLAVIVSNVFSASFNGRIVTRHQFMSVDTLVQIGYPSQFSSDTKRLTGTQCRVRVLKAGEQITVC